MDMGTMGFLHGSRDGKVSYGSSGCDGTCNRRRCFVSYGNNVMHISLSTGISIDASGGPGPAATDLVGYIGNEGF